MILVGERALHEDQKVVRKKTPCGKVESKPLGRGIFKPQSQLPLPLEQAAIHPTIVLPVGLSSRPISGLAWHVAVPTFFLFFLYILFLSVLPKFENALEVNFLISPIIISFFAIVLGLVIFAANFLSAFFGLQTVNWKSATEFSILASLAFIGVGVALKWLLINTTAEFAHLSIFGLADMQVNDQQIEISPLYCLAIVLYLVLTPLQEFVARCCLQAPLPASLASTT